MSSAIERKMEFSTHRKTWSWLNWLDLTLIGLGTLVVIWPFWQPGISSTFDMLFGIYRVFELDEAWRNGLYYPRLGVDLNFTYTAPLFQFYPPLVSYATLVFHWVGMGLVEAAKAMFTLTLWLAGSGTYVYARWLFNDRRAALMSAIAYLLAPYLLTNIYERGAAAETLAWALLPWVFWSLSYLLYGEEPRAFWLSSGLVALLILAHNITALFVIPFVVIYFGFIAWREHVWRRLPIVGLAVVLGLAVSAFYWLPALTEKSYAQIESAMLAGNARAEENLVSLGDLVQPRLEFDYWGPLRFRLSLWQALFGGLSLLGLGVLQKSQRYHLGLGAAATLVILLLQLTISRPFWEGMPLVRFIQFPWRLLGLASFCIALLIGSLFCTKRLAGWFSWLLVVLVTIFIVRASTGRLSPELSSIWYSFSSSQVGKMDLFERGRFGYASDYLPIWMSERSTALAQPRPSKTTAHALAAPPMMRIISESPLHLMLQVQTEQPFTLFLHRLFFPGWQASIDGRTIPTFPSGSFGLVSAELPAGDYTVQVQFEETPLRQAANGLSSLGLLVWVNGTAASRASRRMLLIVGIVLTILVGLSIQHYRLDESPRRPIAYPANLQDEIHLLGFHLAKSVWRPGETLTLRLYWLTQRTPEDNYKVFLHLTNLDDSDIIAQWDSEPIMGYSPTTRWEPGELVDDIYEMPLDETISPGMYRLVVGMYRPDMMKNLFVRQAPHILPGDRLALTEIEIRGK